MQISLCDAQQDFIPVGVPYIKAPWFRFSTIDLTGDGGTVFVSVSLDEPDTWPGGYFENSRHLKLKLDGGKVSCIAKGYQLPTFRKVKAATPTEAVAKINCYLAKAEVVA